MKIIAILALSALTAFADEPTTNMAARPGQLLVVGQMDEKGVITPAPKVIDVLQPILNVTNPDTRTQELLSGLIALATTAFGLWMRYQNLKNQAALVGTIQGVEEIRTALQSSDKGKDLDAKIVEVLQRKQEASGAISVVQKLLEKHTGSTTASPQIKDLL
jgi:hypothetical protein